MSELKENIDDNFNFDLPKNRSNVIKVIGVGGGGGNAINYMFKQGISGVDFVVCNTDSQALEKSPVPIKIQLGVSLTEGLGAGANPEIGSLAAKESEEELISLLSNQTKMVFITAGMGGGTGTGAAPIIAQMSKQLDILTVGIVTIPFQFEGKMRSEQAQTGIEFLRENVDSLIVINNNKLREVYGNLGFKSGFAKADEALATAARGIAEVITHHYRQNIDLKDAKTVLSNSGTAIMGSAVAEGPNRAEESVIKALDSPLLNDNKIEGCKNVLLLIVSGEDEITIDEIGEINDFIQSQAGNNTNIIMGIGEDKNLKQEISVTIIATGFNSDQQHEIVNIEAKKIIHTLEEDQSFSQDLTYNNKVNKEENLNPDRELNNFSSSKNTDKSEKLNFLQTSKFDDKNNLIRTDNNIKNIETISSQVLPNTNENDFKNEDFIDENELLESEEIIDFGEINELDSSQIKFDFNENLDDPKETGINKSNIGDEIEFNNFENNESENLNVNSQIEKDHNSESEIKENLIEDDFNSLKDNNDNNSKIDNQSGNLELGNTDADDLNIKIKKIENVNDLNEQKIEVDLKSETPFDNSIEETIKKSNNPSKEELKKFNYSFQNNIKRINEMDKQPAYKRLDIILIKKTKIKKFSLTLDKDKNDEVQLRSNNSFLHDNVD